VTSAGSVAVATSVEALFPALFCVRPAGEPVAAPPHTTDTSQLGAPVEEATGARLPPVKPSFKRPLTAGLGDVALPVLRCKTIGGA
jgi:hypothetical protein